MPSSISHLPSPSTHSSDEVLVRVENVSKKFCRSLKKSLWYGVKDMAAEILPFGRREDGRLKIEDGVRSQSPLRLERGDALLRTGEKVAQPDEVPRPNFHMRGGEVSNFHSSLVTRHFATANSGPSTTSRLN